MVLTGDHAADACNRVMLGVVRSETRGAGIQAALRKARPVLLAIVAMYRLAEGASITDTATVVAHSLRLRRLKCYLDRARMWTWLNPRPAGGRCACCPYGVHRARDVAFGDVQQSCDEDSARPISSHSARWAALQADGVRNSMARVAARLQCQVHVLRARARDATDDARPAADLFRRSSADHYLLSDRGPRLLQMAAANDAARRAVGRAVAAVNFLAWFKVQAKFCACQEMRSRLRARSAEAAFMRVQCEMRARQKAGRKRRCEADDARSAAIAAVLRSAEEVQARAQGVLSDRVRRECDAAHALCAEADAELERATARLVLDWQSRRWGEVWAREWQDMRLAGGILSAGE